MLASSDSERIIEGEWTTTNDLPLLWEKIFASLDSEEWCPISSISLNKHKAGSVAVSTCEFLLFPYHATFFEGFNNYFIDCITIVKRIYQLEPKDVYYSTI